MPSITNHAFDRYREHHPTARFRDLKKALRYGFEVTQDEAFALSAGNPLHPKYVGHLCSFVLSPDGRGLFIIKPHRGVPGGRLIVVTYLRLPQDGGRQSLIEAIQQRTPWEAP